MQGVQVSDNYVTGDDDNDGEGLGGGIAVVERCDIEGDTDSPSSVPICSVASAEVYKSAITGNGAKSAGGGLAFAGSSPTGRLIVQGSLIGGNRVASDINADGVGGGLYIGRPNFVLTDLSLPGNAAYYGGAMFIAANMSRNATIARIASANNTAVLGSTAFWLRSASLQKELDVSSVLIQPFEPTSLSTEVLAATYSILPPTVIQSAQDVTPFAVEMVDYYGQPGLAERGGNCVVAPATGVNGTTSASGAEGDNSTAVVRSQGAEAGVVRGAAVFSQVFVTGQFEVLVLHTH
jgi:hypothetical protein